MSKEEIERLEIVGRVVDGIISQRQAAGMLGLTDRQVRRLQRAYEAEGASALVSKKRGRPSNRRLGEPVKQAILTRVRERYAGFGPSLAAEYLRQDGHVVSKETVRSWMVQAGLWKVAHGKRGKVHPPRLRRLRMGELIQIDGSPHD